MQKHKPARAGSSLHLPHPTAPKQAEPRAEARQKPGFNDGEKPDRIRRPIVTAVTPELRAPLAGPRAISPEPVARKKPVARMTREQELRKKPLHQKKNRQKNRAQCESRHDAPPRSFPLTQPAQHQINSQRRKNQQQRKHRR